MSLLSLLVALGVGYLVLRVLGANGRNPPFWKFLTGAVAGFIAGGVTTWATTGGEISFVPFLALAFLVLTSVVWLKLRLFNR